MLNTNVHAQRRHDRYQPAYHGIIDYYVHISSISSKWTKLGETHFLMVHGFKLWQGSLVLRDLLPPLYFAVFRMWQTVRDISFIEPGYMCL